MYFAVLIFCWSDFCAEVKAHPTHTDIVKAGSNVQIIIITTSLYTKDYTPISSEANKTNQQIMLKDFRIKQQIINRVALLLGSGVAIYWFKEPKWIVVESELPCSVRLKQYICFYSSIATLRLLHVCTTVRLTVSNYQSYLLFCIS